MSDRELLREALPVMYHADGCAHWKHKPCSCGVLAIKNRITTHLSTPAEDVVPVPRKPTPEMVLAASSVHRKWENADGDFSGGYWQAIYRAMLDAAQKG